MPDEETKLALEKLFDDIFATETCSEVLDAALRRVAKNKEELLLVLDRPDIPLHNNLSERDIREYVKKRKISGLRQRQTLPRHVHQPEEDMPEIGCFLLGLSQ